MICVNPLIPLSRPLSPSLALSLALSLAFEGVRSAGLNVAGMWRRGQLRHPYVIGGGGGGGGGGDGGGGANLDYPMFAAHMLNATDADEFFWGTFSTELV